MPCKSNRLSVSSPENEGFTLLELIIVIVIIGVLATLGFTQYAKVIESSRISEAKIRLGTMQKIALEYYWKNGALTSISNSDLGIGGGCTSTSYYSYYYGDVTATMIDLCAQRCTTGGKTPDASVQYTFGVRMYVDTGATTYWCFNGPNGSLGYSCYGYAYTTP